MAEPYVLRLATANLLHGRNIATGEALESDLRATARALDADVVGLQEVDRRQERSGGLDQAAVVADEVGAVEWRFLPTMHGAPGGADAWTITPKPHRRRGRKSAEVPAAAQVESAEVDTGSPAYGVALISRLPVLEWHTWTFPPGRIALPLAVPGGGRVRFRWVADEPRAAIAAVLDTPAGPLTVATTHLSFVPGTNVRQLRRVTEALRGLPAPHLLFGDFNLPGRVPVRTTGWRQLTRMRTYPVWRPRVQFDHVLTSSRHVHTVDAEAVPLPVSDHLGVRLGIRLRG